MRNFRIQQTRITPQQTHHLDLQRIGTLHRPVDRGVQCRSISARCQNPDSFHGLSHHKIHQSTRDHNHLHHRLTLQLTPHHLAQLDTTHCPITRELLGDDNRSIDRVRDDAGYAAGNLAVMSRRANQAKGSRDHQALQAMAAGTEKAWRPTSAVESRKK